MRHFRREYYRETGGQTRGFKESLRCKSEGLRGVVVQQNGHAAAERGNPALKPEAARQILKIGLHPRAVIVEAGGNRAWLVDGKGRNAVWMRSQLFQLSHQTLNHTLYLFYVRGLVHACPFTWDKPTEMK